MPTVMQQPLVWFFIPATDVDRATDFYNHVLGLEMRPTDYMGERITFFPMAEGQAGGHIGPRPEAAGKSGVVVYLNGGEDLNGPLARAVSRGSMVTLPRTDLGQGMGFIAHFTDSEGNEVGLWSPK
mgnify:CR=1 FL=1